MDAERLLSEEDAGWRVFHDTIARIPPDRIAEPSVTPEGWSPKDVMFHVGAWLAEACTQLERMRAGTFDPNEDLSRLQIERLNQRWQRVGHELDLPTVRVELESSRVCMLMAWGELPEITTTAWEWFEESGPHHYDEHVQDLQTWLDGPGS